MSTNTPFAYNPGSNISGTQKIGNISFGTPDSGFQNSSLKWWNGPDEDLGYVITKPDPEGLHIGGDESIAYLGFRRSDSKTEASFIELANNMFNQNFTTGNAAKTWLNDNGYWTSWVTSSSSGNSFNLGDYKLAAQYAPAQNNGDITFPAHPQIAGSGFGTTNPNLVGTEDSNYKYQLYINASDTNGNDRSSVLDQLIDNAGTLTLTQGSNSVTYNFTNQAFNHTNVGPSTPYFYDSQFGTGGPGIGASHLGSLTVLSAATSDFNTSDPVSISITTV